MKLINFSQDMMGFVCSRFSEFYSNFDFYCLHCSTKLLKISAWYIFFVYYFYSCFCSLHFRENLLFRKKHRDNRRAGKVFFNKLFFCSYIFFYYNVVQSFNGKALEIKNKNYLGKSVFLRRVKSSILSGDLYWKKPNLI